MSDVWRDRVAEACGSFETLGAELVPTDVAVVFADLRDSLESLDQARGSPRDVRRALSRYVELSQRLTSAMRKGYGGRGTGKWEASRFSGWTSRTELLKYLRNQDQHDHQVYVTVCETMHYTLPADVEVRGIPRSFVVRGTWNITDHLMTAPPEGLEVCLSDTPGPGSPKDVLAPEKVERQYILLPRNDEQKQKFEAAGASDVHELAHDTFSTLSKYHEFFRSESGT